MNRLILIVCLVLCGCDQGMNRCPAGFERVYDPVIKEYVCEGPPVKVELEKKFEPVRPEVFEYAVRNNLKCYVNKVQKCKNDCKYGQFDEKGKFCDNYCVVYQCSDGKEFLVE